MLGELDRINWAGLSHAGGEASDVPGMIRELLAPDGEMREQAISRLFATIWHQGTVYEASSHAVPFLQELLRSSATPDKMRIAQLLAELANGVAFLEFTKYSEAMENLTRESLAKAGRDYEQELPESRRFVVETRTAVGKDLALLYPYLGCDIPEIRAAVAAALKHYPERRDELLPLLERAAESEVDAQAMESMEATIAALGSGAE